MIKSAHKYTKLGLSCLPCGKDKAPAIKAWKQWMEEIPTKEECNANFSTPAIGILGGKVSGGLEIIDVDSKYHPKGTAFNEEVLSCLGFDALVVQTTSGGLHIYYRCPEPGNNMKLAGRPVSEGKTKVKYFIETRGEGGYVIAPPSEGYKVLHGSFDNIPTISQEDRDEWLDSL